MSTKKLSLNESRGALQPAVEGGGDRRPRSYSYYNVPARGYVNDRNEDSISQYWRALIRRKGTVLLAALAGGLLAVLLTLPQAPVYRAQTSIEVQNLNDDFLNTKNVSPMSNPSAFQSPEYNIRTQATVLQSRPVLERAISRLSITERQSLAGTGEAPKPSAWRKALGLREPPPVSPHDQAVAQVEAGLKVLPEPSTRVIKLSFDSTDPRLAADLANSLAESFIQMSLENRWQTSQSTVDWLMKQMEHLKTKLKRSEEELQRFARSSNLTILSEKDNVNDDRLRQLQADLSKAQTDAVAKQSRFELASSAPPESLPEILDDATLKEYQVELTTLRRQLAELQSQYTSEHPKVEKVQAQISTLEAALEKKRANIVSRIKNEFVDAQRRENLLTRNYNAQTGVMAKQADKVAQYSMLKREVDTTRALYDSMLQKVTEAGLASAMRASDIHVVEQATPPNFPFKPNMYLNTAFGLVSGLCIGMGFVIQRARSDRGIQEPGDTTLHLNVPELGVIPASSKDNIRVPRLLRGKSGAQTADVNGTGPERLELTTWQQQLSVIAESFRLTLTSILFSGQNGSRPRVIVLSSANPREGKTTVVSNLGIALAQANQRVLLVDGDMRRPRLHDIFGVDNHDGLGDVLCGKSPLSVLETKIPNLFLLPSGHSDDAGLLFKPELRALLRRLKAEFDMILIDTPPMLQMPDARLFGRHADAVILVVAQHTARDAVQMACQRLNEDGSVLLGTILNNWNPKHSTHPYTEYRDYYKSYARQAQ
jgi:succinoglycan biosynthesis transport protein ExoP